LDALPLIIVAKAVPQVSQSHGRTVPTALTNRRYEVISLGVLSAATLAVMTRGTTRLLAGGAGLLILAS
jgi:hypothetical protein